MNAILYKCESKQLEVSSRYAILRYLFASVLVHSRFRDVNETLLLVFEIKLKSVELSFYTELKSVYLEAYI